MAKIQHENGEYRLETLEEIQKRADDNGLLVVFPGPTEIQIDIDSDEQYKVFQARLNVLGEHLPTFKVVRNAPSRSGLPKRHITIDMGQELTEDRRIALQSVLGSDPTRELLNCVEHILGMEHSVLFYERRDTDLIQTPGGLWDKDNDTFYQRPYQMTCGLSEQAQRKYKMFEDRIKHGRLWFVADVPNAADFVYCGYPYDTKSQGFAGRWMDFQLVGGETVKIQGPWHSNSDSLFECTGHDVRDTCETFVIVAKTRHFSGGETFFKDILYADQGPVLGRYGRYQQIAQGVANELGQPVMYYMSSNGGSSSGQINPSESE